METSMMELRNREVVFRLGNLLIDEFCGRNGPSRDDFYPQFWSDEKEFSKFCENFRKIIEMVASRNIRNASKVINGVFQNQELEKWVMEMLEIRRAELKFEAINDLIRQSNPRFLHDFDWRANVILAGDKVTGMGDSLLTLDLCLTGNDKSNETLSLELDKDDLRRLIESLEYASMKLKS